MVVQRAFEPEEVSMVRAQKVLEENSRIGTKASGPDGIPNQALQLAMKTVYNVFQLVYEKSLREVHFPKIWKFQRLFLLPKGH